MRSTSSGRCEPLAPRRWPSTWPACQVPGRRCRTARRARAEIRDGEVLLFDFGARVAGYRSDMTRTLFVGEPSEPGPGHLRAGRARPTGGPRRARRRPRTSGQAPSGRADRCRRARRHRGGRSRRAFRARPRPRHRPGDARGTVARQARHGRSAAGADRLLGRAGRLPAGRDRRAHRGPRGLRSVGRPLRADHPLPARGDGRRRLRPGRRNRPPAGLQLPAWSRTPRSATCAAARPRSPTRSGATARSTSSTCRTGATWSGTGSCPMYARFLRRLGSFARVITMDRRGMGCSDRMNPGETPSLEVLVDDLLAVVEAAQGGPPALLSCDEGFISLLAAAAHPDRFSAMILYGATPSYAQTDDMPWEWSEDRWAGFLGQLRRTTSMREWTEQWMRRQYPSLKGDREAFEWLVDMSPCHQHPDRLGRGDRADEPGGSALRSCPASVCRRSSCTAPQDPGEPVESGRYLAAHIGGARLVELPGEDSVAWVGRDRRRSGRDRGVPGRRANAAGADPCAGDGPLHRHRRIDRARRGHRRRSVAATS